MSSNARITRWNARYAARERPPEAEPLPLLVRGVGGVRPGRALDLACGTGRHAIWLAARGWRVAAVDGASAALDLLLARAENAGVRGRVEPHVADLEADPPEFAIEATAYDLIVDCHFLHRPLLHAIRNGVRPGGTVRRRTARPCNRRPPWTRLSAGAGRAGGIGDRLGMEPTPQRGTRLDRGGGSRAGRGRSRGTASELTGTPATRRKRNGIAPRGGCAAARIRLAYWS